MNPLCVVFAEIGITVLGVFALVEGLDGAIFVTTIISLAGLGGYEVRQHSKIIQANNNKDKK